MKVVAIIPVKMHNQRCPDKNTKPLHDGTPLMHLIQKTCKATPEINETYVYCSDESVTGFLLPDVYFLKRPAYLDADEAHGNDIIAEFIKEVDADIYVYAHTTAPFVKSASLSLCINKIAWGEHDSSFLASRIRAFMWQNNIPLNFDPKNLPRTQDLPPIFAETSGAYVFKKTTFSEIGRRIGSRPFICEVSGIEALDIDYPEDFEMADMIYKEKLGGWQ